MAQYEITAINSVNNAKFHAIQEAEDEQKAIEIFTELHQDLTFQELQISAIKMSKDQKGLVIKHIDDEEEESNSSPSLHEVYGSDVTDRLTELSNKLTKLIAAKGALIGFLIGWFLDIKLDQDGDPVGMFYRIGGMVLGAVLGAIGAQTCILFLDWMKAVLQNLQEQNKS